MIIKKIFYKSITKKFFNWVDMLRKFNYKKRKRESQIEIVFWKNLQLLSEGPPIIHKIVCMFLFIIFILFLIIAM